MSATASMSSARVARTRTSPRSMSDRLVVDLGSLEPAAEVDVDRLPLRERVERDVARLPVAVARVLPATEREVRLGARGACVDVHDPRLEVADRPERRVHVTGVDRRGQAVAD